MNPALLKGRLLEYAIAQIEESLLRNDPSLKGAEGLVEKNKVFVVDAVRHEVDVWITVNKGTHFESTHIIECKNWKSPVGTDEISKLAIKRAALGASSSTVVARRFTRDARALAKQHRIELLRASEDLAPANFELSIHSPKLESGNVAVTYRIFNGPAPTLDYGSTPCRYNGRRIILGLFLGPLIQHQIAEVSHKDPRKKLGGLFTGRINKKIIFAPKALYVEEHEVAHVDLNIDYSVDVSLPIATWRIGVEKRGGLIQFFYPNGTMGYENVSIEVVTKPEAH